MISNIYASKYSLKLSVFLSSNNILNGKRKKIISKMLLLTSAIQTYTPVEIQISNNF